MWELLKQNAQIADGHVILQRTKKNDVRLSRKQLTQIYAFHVHSD